jgi:AhpC/TSA family
VQEGEGAMRTRTQDMRSLLWLGVLLVSVLGGTGVTAALEIGEAAPDFTLPSTTGEQISLSQFRGKQPVLLEFYGSDFSPA